MFELKIDELALIIVPVVLSGILNMVWVKNGFAMSMKKPMDAGRCAADGRRYFGDNKTWKGFYGMIVLTALCAIAVHGVIILFGSATPPYSDLAWPLGSLLFGSLMGLAYVLGELPNSYIKRRLMIQPGENGSGPVGILFIVIDQIDSVFACCLVILFFYPLTIAQFSLIVVGCGVIHILINMLLYSVKLKSQIF